MSKQSLKIQFKEPNIENFSEIGEAALRDAIDILADQALEIQKQEIRNQELDEDFWGYPQEERIINGARVWKKKDGTMLTVSNVSPHAVWVEFGTGIRGGKYVSNKKVKPYPMGGKSMGMYKPNSDNTGWVYHLPEPTDYESDNGRVHETEFFFTKGMRARPFMYNTFSKLQQVGKIEGNYWKPERFIRLNRLILARGWRGKK